MLKRMPEKGHDQIKIALWHALGEIYRTRLKEFNAAIQAFEVAAGLDPNNAARHEILAELYVMAGPDFSQKAVQEHMTLVKRDPFRVESYKALRKIYMDTRQYDKAWCMCSALTFLQRADADETQFYEQYKQKGFVKAKARLTDEMWAKNVFHPEEDRYISNIFAAVYQAVALLKSGEHKQFGLKRKDKRDLTTDQALFSKVFNYVTQVLNIQQPEVYFRPEQQGGMQLANTKEKGVLIPSLVVGAELLAGSRRQGAGVPDRPLPDDAAARALLAPHDPDEHRAGHRVLGGREVGAAELPGAAEPGADGRPVPDGDAADGAAGVARAAGAGREALHSDQGADRSVQVVAGGRSDGASRRLHHRQRPGRCRRASSRWSRRRLAA
jgi:hypothetical protein